MGRLTAEETAAYDAEVRRTREAARARGLAAKEALERAGYALFGQKMGVNEYGASSTHPIYGRDHAARVKLFNGDEEAAFLQCCEVLADWARLKGFIDG